MLNYDTSIKHFRYISNLNYLNLQLKEKVNTHKIFFFSIIISEFVIKKILMCI